jgi:hypothetical protein
MKKKSNKPGIGELRQFGLMFALIMAALFGLLIPFIRFGLEVSDWPRWPWMVVLLFVMWSLLHPGSLGIVHTLWMKFAKIAQWVNTHIIMLFLFYVMIFPIGMMLRLFGKDSMHRKFDQKAKSYRVKAEMYDKEQMEKPF